MSEAETAVPIIAVEDGGRRVEFAAPEDPKLELWAALLKAQSEFPEIPKDRENTYFHSWYSTLDAIKTACWPVLHRHGLMPYHLLHNAGGKLTVTFVIRHAAAGQTFENALTRDEAPGEQALGSQITYLRRYTCVSPLGICSDEDDDGNAASGRGDGKAPSGGASASTGKTGKSGGLTKEERDQRKAEADAKKKAAMEGAAGGAPDSTGTTAAGHSEKDVLERGLNSISACKTVADANQLYDKFGETQWLADHKPVYLQLLDALGRELEKRKQQKAWDPEQCDGLAASVQGLITHLSAAAAAPVHQELV